MTQLIDNYDLRPDALGHLTSAVQLGFIIGTLIFAILTLVDRYSPSKVFLACAIMGALSNLGLLWQSNSMFTLLSFRLTSGFFLAGIYPVGMKIAADYYNSGLGKSLGFLVGALVLGTALPHLLNEYNYAYSWTGVIKFISLLAILGGTFMAVFVKDGPNRKPSQSVDLSAFAKVFKDKQFRKPAFGYFGHMWELYAFWAFVPVMLHTYIDIHPEVNFKIPILSFTIIGIGSAGCILGGYISVWVGSHRTVFYSLLLSALCCVLSPFIFQITTPIFFIAFLLFWGLVVIADSPQFSTLVAQSAPPEIKGTALTIVNSIGFAITIVSIQILNWLSHTIDPSYIYLLLVIGPIVGLTTIRSKKWNRE